MVAAATSAWAQPASQAAQPLTRTELLGAVERALPLLERARQDVAIAEGELREARGAFDLSFKASATTVRGFYDSERVSGRLEQPLATLGITTYGGYRLGRGVFAPYDGKSGTLSEGEFSGGLNLPLLRNRATDARRAAQQVTELGVEVASRGLDKARLSYFKQALSEYWDWVGAGQQTRVARDLLALAEARDQQLADAIALGQIPPVERTDNRRAILQRRSALFLAERQLQMKAIDLSLFLRAIDGSPERPGEQRLPELPGPSGQTEPDEVESIRRALERRPELMALRLKRQQQEAELRLAENTVLPTLDLFSELSRDVGSGPASRAGEGFEAGVIFQVPFQRRKATGKVLQVRGKLATVDQDLRWAEDEIRAEVQDAISALRAARVVLDVVTEELTVARELESLERDRFTLGDSTQFLVNLREVATADAALREVRARADQQKALVAVEAATGQLLDAGPRP
ncbi:TolC family protein [Luteitalea sp.]|uniref:TolC family protein n=1 Tax=Luteitalea sp. TaxID=2004800 RepID=UPI0025C09A3E|nr:TolC family protein [Luteitalea sp.]